MRKSPDRKHHQQLHDAMEELIADYLAAQIQPPLLASTITVGELMVWSVGRMRTDRETASELRDIREQPEAPKTESENSQ